MSKRTIPLAEAAALDGYYGRIQVASGSVEVDAGLPVGTSAVICTTHGKDCRHSFADSLYHCQVNGCSTAYAMLPQPRVN